jgi:KaiC/GvpD/RAD55 family RecA-like ATPase
MSTADAAYVRALIDGQEPAGALPDQSPWSELARALGEAHAHDRPEVMARWADDNSDGAVEVMRELVHLNSGEPANRSTPTRSGLEIMTLGSLLERRSESVPVLVGEENNAIIVREEGHLIAGPAGVGKTWLVFDLALQLAAGGNVLGYRTREPLNVLLVQAELPLGFVQWRFRRMTETPEYFEASCQRDSLSRIHVASISMSGAGMKQTVESISKCARRTSAQVVLLDPFLPFFDGEENSNAEVRRSLDLMKDRIARDCGSAIIVTDHISKADTERLNKVRGARVRGASAKVDWASLVINLSMSGDGYIDAHLTKTRYARPLSRPIRLRRDARTFRHTTEGSHFEGGHAERGDQNEEILRGIFEAEGGVIPNKTIMVRLLRERMGMSFRGARSYIEQEEFKRIVEADPPGPSNVIIYRLRGSDGEEDDSADAMAEDGDRAAVS